MLPLAAGLRALPPRGRVLAGRALGRLLHALDRHHRRLARRNLVERLRLDDRTAARTAREVFAHFGRTAAEVLALPAYARPGCERLFEIEGLEHLQEAHAAGRGVLVFSAHFGNWELVAQRQALAGIPLDFIARPLDNPWLERAFTRWREQAGNRVLGKHGALRGAVRSLREGRAVAILIDQNVRTPPRLFLPFLGRTASVTPTLARLAVRLGAAAVPVRSTPRADGGYRIVYLPPLKPLPTGDEDERVRELTARASALIEQWIRERPELWLWLHDRWKSQPEPGERVEAP